MNKLMMFAALMALVAATLVKADAKEQQPLRVVPSVDLKRYAGRWYEIARLPNRFQKDCDGDVIAEYTVIDDGQIKVINQCRKQNGETKKAEGKARLASKKGPNTKLEVRFAPSFLSFLPFVWGDYWIIDLATDYSYAVVGEPGRKYMWVLSRTPQMAESSYQEALKRAAEQGYDVSRVVKTKQSS